MEDTTPLMLIDGELEKLRKFYDASDTEDTALRAFYRGQIWALYGLRDKVMDTIRIHNPQLGKQLDSYQTFKARRLHSQN